MGLCEDRGCYEITKDNNGLRLTIGGAHHDRKQRDTEIVLRDTRFASPTDVGKGVAQAKKAPSAPTSTPSDYAAVKQAGSIANWPTVLAFVDWIR
jgi:hypothetical protein